MVPRMAYMNMLVGGCNLQAGHSLTNPNLTDTDTKRLRLKRCRPRSSCQAGLKPRQCTVMVALIISNGHSLALPSISRQVPLLCPWGEGRYHLLGSNLCLFCLITLSTQTANSKGIQFSIFLVFVDLPEERVVLFRLHELLKPLAVVKGLDVQLHAHL